MPPAASAMPAMSSVAVVYLEGPSSRWASRTMAEARSVLPEMGGPTRAIVAGVVSSPRSVAAAAVH